MAHQILNCNYKCNSATKIKRGETKYLTWQFNSQWKWREVQMVSKGKCCLRWRAHGREQGKVLFIFLKIFSFCFPLYGGYRFGLAKNECPWWGLKICFYIFTTVSDPQELSRDCRVIPYTLSFCAWSFSFYLITTLWNSISYVAVTWHLTFFRLCPLLMTLTHLRKIDTVFCRLSFD